MIEFIIGLITGIGLTLGIIYFVIELMRRKIEVRK